jgi:S-(hydroxymethyl)glutathione dehydrogenase/alcohol dehydrogenase
MRAALLEEPESVPVMVDDVEIVGPRAGEVVVDVAYCGLCHSDLSLMNGTFPAEVPVVLGHEAAGTVAEIGEGVTRLAVGDKVMLTPTPSCGACYWCVRDQASLCVNSVGVMTHRFLDGETGLRRGDETVMRGMGVGAFAEQAIVLQEGAIKLPDDVDLSIVAVIGCAVQTGVGSAINLAKIEPGATVLVMGLGGIGISIVQGARLAGAARIIVSDPVSERRDGAEKFGATDAIDPMSEDVMGRCFELTNGIGVDYSFDAVGSGPLIETGFYATRNGGTIVAVGAGPIDQTINIPPPMFAISQKTLMGSMLGGVNSQRDIPLLIDLYRAGRLDLENMITDRRPIDELDQACDDMTAGRGLRTLLEL